MLRQSLHGRRAPTGHGRAVGIPVPVVVRLEGTNVDLGKQILADSGLNLITADGMEDAAAKVVKAAKGL